MARRMRRNLLFHFRFVVILIDNEVFLRCLHRVSFTCDGDDRIPHLCRPSVHDGFHVDRTTGVVGCLRVHKKSGKELKTCNGTRIIKMLGKKRKPFELF